MDQQNLIDSYNNTAEKYAEHLFEELSAKPLDRILLRQFAEENKSRKTLIDLGCGPGQTTRFLFEHGVHDIVGVDISEKMINKAKQLTPHVRFETADMLQLKYADDSFGSAVAFYSIVHFTKEQLKIFFNQANRVLVKGGELLFAFHIGNQIVHRNELFGVAVHMDFYFFETEFVIELVKQAKFKVLDVIERHPYENAEHPSRRAYIKVEKM